jgi:hypothetical protein
MFIVLDWPTIMTSWNGEIQILSILYESPFFLVFGWEGKDIWQILIDTWIEGVGGDALSPLVDDQHTTYLTKLKKKHWASILQVKFLIATNVNPLSCVSLPLDPYATYEHRNSIVWLLQLIPNA